MGVRIIQADGIGDSTGAVFYCSTTGWAFGPVMEDREEAEKFLEFLSPVDPRTLKDNELSERYAEFHKQTNKGDSKHFSDGSPTSLYDS